MRITLDGCGNRGYRHIMTNADLASLRENEGLGRQHSYEDSEMIHNDYNLMSQIRAKFSFDSDGGPVTGITIRQMVDVRTNGSYIMYLHLTAGDIMMLAWIVMRDRSMTWITDEFARLRESVKRPKKQRVRESA